MENINNINLGKIQPKKLTKQQKAELEKQIVEQRNDSEVAGKGASKASRAYAAAMIALGLLPGMTSCMEQTQNVDTTGLEKQMAETNKLIQQLIDQQAKNDAYIQKLLEQNNADNKELIALVKDLKLQNTQIQEILRGLTNSVENFEDNVMSAILKIIALAEKANANDNEFLAKLQEIIDGQGTNSQKLDKILDANNEQNALMMNLVDLIGKLGGDLGDKIDNIYNEYLEGNQEHSEMLNNIFKELLNSNDLSKQQLEAIYDIKKLMEAGQLSESEALGKITEILQNIDNKISDLLTAIEGLAAGNEELATMIKEFHEDYKDGTITENALLAKILTAIENQNQANPELLAELQKIREAVESGNKTAAEGLADVKDLLGQINSNVEAVLEAIKDLSAKVGDLIVKVDDNQLETLEILKNINDGIGSIDTKLDQIQQNQKADNKVMTEISNKLDGLTAKMDALGDKVLTKEDVADLLGPLYTDIAEIREAIGKLGDHITIEDLQDILQGYKTDLTKTNALIETLTNVVQNLNLSGDSGDMSKIAEILNQIKADGNASRDEINTNLQEIIQQLGSIDATLKALQDTANEIKANQEKFFGQALDFGGDLMTEIKNLAKGQGDTNKLLAAAKDYTEALQEAEKTRQEMLEVMKSILANQGTNEGGGNFSIDYDKLKELLPDYSGILKEIRDAIGNVITSSDLENFFVKTQPDLTKTNALIETLTNVVQNKNFTGGAGSADMAKVESLLGNILDAINAKKLPTAEQIQELIDAANKVVNNTSSSESRSTKADLYAALNEIEAEIAKQTGVKGTYHFYPGSHYNA